MKKYLFTSVFFIAILLTCSFSARPNNNKANILSFPLTGKIKFVNSPMIEYKQIYFMVFNKNGNEILNVNHSIGTGVSQEISNLSNLIDADYKSLMTKNGNKLRERNYHLIRD